MNSNNLAWMKGAAAYTPGDTVDQAKLKAAEQGYKPYHDGYGAFITAFAREVRLHRQVPGTQPTAVAAPDEKKYQRGGFQAA